MQGEIMDQEIETFVEELLQETDVICCLCNGTGRDYFGDDCSLCDGIGKLLDCDDEVIGMQTSQMQLTPLSTRNPSDVSRPMASGRRFAAP